MIGHGGGINGFLSESRYYTEEDAIVVVLLNTTGPASPGAIADAIGRHLFGDDAGPVAGTYPGDLNALVGEFTGPSRGRTMTARTAVDDEGRLTIQAGGPAEPVEFLSGTTFFRGTTRYTFELENDAPARLRLDNVGGHYVLEAGELGERKEVTVPEAVMAAHVGRYALSDAFAIEVTFEDGRLFGQATGQSKFPLFADGDNEYHLEVVEASVSFVVEDGLTVALILHQGGRDQRGERVAG